MRMTPTLLAGILLTGPALAQPATSADIAAQTRVLHNDLAAYTGNIVAAIKAQPSDPAGLSAKLDVLHNDLQALIAQLKAGTTTVTASTGTVAPSTDAAYFPAQAGNALFPSPENSSILRVGNEVQGRPYLRDKTGTLFTMFVPAAGEGGSMVGGTQVALQYGDPGHTVDQLLERGGNVWARKRLYGWQYWNPEQGNWYPGSLPDAIDPNAPVAAAPAASAIPTLPVPSTIAPGSSGRVLKAAPGQVAAVLATAKDGDTLELSGRYAEPFPILTVALLIHMEDGTVIDFTDQPLAQGKGGLVPAKDLVVEGKGTLVGAGIKEGQAGGTACIRPAATAYVTVRAGVTISGCQNGVAGGGFPWVLDMADVTLDGNGLGDGYTHNLYVSEGGVRVTLTRVTSRNPRGGHAIKSRAPLFGCNACTLSADETVLDLPNGTASVATVVNSTLTKNPGAANHRLIGYGEEGAKNGAAGLTITGGTVTGGDAPFIQGSGPVTFDQVAVVGTKPTAAGVTLSGM